MLVHYTILLVGFIAIEATFDKLGEAAAMHRPRLAKVKHLSVMAWIIHPACVDACAKIIEHAVSEGIGVILR